MNTNALDRQANRINWIDCAKAVAIVGVIVDHNNGLLYRNPFIANASYFSVSLFILLSGITTWITGNKKGMDYEKQLKKIAKLYLQYALATFLLFIYYYHFFDWNVYLQHLMNFSIQGPYYFFLFFFQLMLIAPILVSWCQFCNRRKRSYIWHGLSILLLGYISSLTIRYTYILPVHGGGKYLFGGTYFLLYYIGILFANFQIFCMNKRKRMFVFVVSLCSWLVWWLMMSYHQLPFDKWFLAYWGKGFNPPSVCFIVFAIITLFFCYSFFSLLEEGSNRIGKKIIYFITLVGKNTLYIFMYHLLVQNVIRVCFPIVHTNIWVLRLGIFFPMIVLPTFAVEWVRKIRIAIMR